MPKYDTFDNALPVVGPRGEIKATSVAAVNGTEGQVYVGKKSVECCFPNYGEGIQLSIILEGTFVKRLNTHGLYRFAIVVHPLTSLAHTDGMLLKELFVPIVRAEIQIRQQLEQQEFFSASIKRSAGALLRTIYSLGFPEDDIFSFETTTPVQSYDLSNLVQKAGEFETVLANELPGLPTYLVSQKGLYSTDDLIAQAEIHVPEAVREVLNTKARDDIREAGKCLAFEVGTASAFHMWRAVESVMDLYFETITGKTFADAKVTRNWGEYIKALREVGAEKRITTFLDHIREEYRNPISHPDETLELDEAFSLFGAALSVITQILRTISDMALKAALPPEVPPAAAAGQS